ncbi:hypothetical protein J4O15_04885 [Lachnoanaerobaculum sp. Marseille-Q4761]|jgi:hypothetical protein|uniref:hypothetical protein n=1 Tax=Lachnoanaerobaculum sp. Marseille-Q4761 TaxID=2819511 RepID=UPI001AA191C7|nr:hypothetical protein [Lachnoanaerobaculum sp. Marseille-Q4761]MBO1870276.1 hypothetical protein [Lachnoanaerobaculum sp. Marseille-Q4761]
MNIKNNKIGLLSSIILGIVLILGGLVYAWYNSEVLLTFNSASKMYKDGYYFTSAAKNDTESIYSVAIYDMLDTGYGTDDGKSEVYSIFGDDGIYFLEANPNDSKIKSMIEMYDKYANEEHGEDEMPPVSYLMVEVNNDSYSVLEEIADMIDSNRTYRDAGQLFDDFYLSKTSLTTNIAMHLGITLVAIGLGIGVIVVALFRRSKNQDTYEKLCELDKRLIDNVDELENIADYVDKSLGVYIHKDHLILNTKFGFDMFNLNNLVWIYHNITKHKMYVFITVSVDYSLQINLYEDGKFREQRVMLSNNKNAQGAVESLLTYIGMNYPNSIVGFTPETREAYKNFKLSHR